MKVSIEGKQLSSNELLSIVKSTFEAEIESEAGKQANDIVAEWQTSGHILVVKDKKVEIHCTSCKRSFTQTITPHTVVRLMRGEPLGRFGFAWRPKPLFLKCPNCNDGMMITIEDVIRFFASGGKRFH